MDKVIVLPFDGSPVSCAALVRTAQAVAQSSGVYVGFVLAAAGVDRVAVDRAVERGAALAGPSVPIGARYLTPTDPLGALRDLVESLPEVTLAVPLDVRGASPWYASACRLDLACAKMLLFISKVEVERVAVGLRGRKHSLAGAFRAVFRPWHDRPAPFPAPLWSTADLDRP